MTSPSRSSWDLESLQRIRLVGNRMFRRTVGSSSLALLALLAGVGAWGLDFSARSLPFFFGYWAVVFAVFFFTIFVAMVDYWCIRLEFAVKKRELAQDFLQETRAATAPQNGHPPSPEPPRL